MLLALDIGNTNLVAGVFAGTGLRAHWRLSTQRERTSDELAAFLDFAFKTNGFGFDDIDGVVIASVVPTLTPQAAAMARSYFKCNPIVLGPDTDTGLVNDYDDPRQVGADRLANAVAAWKRYGQTTIIADFGTATTVDAVSHHGHYLGGAIAPGMQISVDALFHAAARLPRVDLKAPAHALGRNTTQSIQAGIFFGYVGMVKELIERCRVDIVAQLGEAPITVAATGGLAELIAPHIPAISHIEPHMTLDGLRLIWEVNRTKLPPGSKPTS